MAQLIVRIPFLFAAALFFVLAGCPKDEGPAVPFKLNGSQQAPRIEPATATEGTTNPPLATTPGQSLAPETTRAAILGRSVELPGATIRATLELDLDHDGTMDAVMVTVDAAGAISLRRLRHDEQTPGMALDLDALPAGCVLQRAQAQAVSNAHLVIQTEHSCASPQPASDKGPPPEPLVSQHGWIVSREIAPRLLERVALLPAEPGTTPQSLTIAWSGDDFDHDDNTDLQATLAIGNGNEHPLELALRWMNRTGGLDRDRSEPEATLTKLVKTAKAAAAEARAISARQAIELHALLCSEGGHARLAVGGTRGLRCGSSNAAGTAWALLTPELSDPFEMVEAFERLSQPGLKVSDAEREHARTAVVEASRRNPWTWTPGPTLDPVTAPQLRKPAIGFRDQHTLLLRGTTTRALDLDTQEVSVIDQQPANLAWVDPTGRFAVVAIERHCDGFHLKLARAEQLVNGLLMGTAHAEPLIATAEPPSHARCGSGSSFRASDTGGYRMLGWVPKGVMIARGRELRFVPLDEQGHSAGDASVSDRGVPLPAPIEPGAAASDGSAYVLPTEVGLLLQRWGNTADSWLIQPLGPVSAEDVAVAPGGTRIAYVFGGQVFIGQPASP